MKYMTDANVSGLAKELRKKGIDCETVHKMMMEKRRFSGPDKDPQIIKFLRERDKKITLITLDNELAEYCKTFEIPCIRVQDLVADHIMKTS